MNIIYYKFREQHFYFWSFRPGFSKLKISTYVKENEEAFSHLDEDVYDMISVMARAKELQKLKKKHEAEGGSANMCQAIKEMIEDGRNEGRSEGRSEGIKIGTFETLWSLVRDGLLQLEEAARRLESSESDFRKQMEEAGY